MFGKKTPCDFCGRKSYSCLCSKIFRRLVSCKYSLSWKSPIQPSPSDREIHGFDDLLVESKCALYAPYISIHALVGSSGYVNPRLNLPLSYKNMGFLIHISQQLTTNPCDTTMLQLGINPSKNTSLQVYMHTSKWT